MESAPSDDEPALWRGHVTHLPDGMATYVATIDQVCEVIVEALRFRDG
jgi:hypothetical protein